MSRSLISSAVVLGELTLYPPQVIGQTMLVDLFEMGCCGS